MAKTTLEQLRDTPFAEVSLRFALSVFLHKNAASVADDPRMAVANEEFQTGALTFRCGGVHG